MKLRKFSGVLMSSSNMMLKGAVAILLSSLLLPHVAMAELSSEEFSRLGIEGTELTPMGAVRAGNKEGTIPKWNSKPISGVAGSEANNVIDPFANEKPLFTITADNYEQYKEKLTVGQVAMFNAYPETFFMNVYPTHRTGSYDERIYKATLEQAKKVTICPQYEKTGRVCLDNAINGGGIPFPIPKTGAEAVWSHYLAFRERSSSAMYNGVLVDYLGRRTDVIQHMRQIYPWWVSNDSELKKNKVLTIMGGSVYCGSQLLKKPTRSAGLMFGGCIYLNDFSARAYLYLPGQRRVRKAPEIGFHDSPSFGSDGMITSEDRWMMWFGGKYTRHDYAPPIRKELFVPYNNNKLADKNLTFDEIFGKKHINQSLVRYELHRVWVVEATVKDGLFDLYKRQTAYFDEDTWIALGNETYDQKDRLWRVGEQYNVFIHGLNITRGIGDVHVDLLTGRYASYPFWQYQTGEIEGFGPPRFTTYDGEDIGFSTGLFTPQGLRKHGRR